MITKESFLLELYRKALSLSDSDLYEYFLDHAVNVTKSTIGFFHFVSEDQKSIKLTEWNKEALKNCKAVYPKHYPIENAGNWADSIRQKRPIIFNDFAKSPNQKGLPKGHTPVKRMLSVPILEEDKVRAVFGVGNKTRPYNKEDVIHLELVAYELTKIMKQRQVERALRESKGKYRSLFANMMDGFAYCKVIFDKSHKPMDFIYLEINEAFERITGLRKEAVIGKRVTKAIPSIKEANPELFDIYGKVAAGGKPEKFELFFKPLNMWLAVSVYSPKKGYFAAIFEDITQRKNAEATLREQGVVISSASDAIFSTDQAFAIKTWNKAAENIFGWKREEVTGKTTTTIFNPVYPTLSGTTREKALEQLLNNGVWKGEIIHHKKDGSQIPVLVSVSLVKDPNGKVAGTVAVAHDITARKKREEELRESQRDLSHAQAVAKAGSWRLDTAKNILLWSDETRRIFGVQKGTILNYETFLSFVHPDDRTYVDREWQAALRGDSYDIEHRIVVEGKVKWVHEIAEIEFNENGSLKGGFGTVQDITEAMELRLKLEELNRDLEGNVEERTKALERKSLYARSLLEASLDPLVTISAEGKITDVNNATELATGCPREQMIGQDFSDYFTEPEKAERGYQEVFSKGYVKDFPLAIRNKSGKTTDVLYNAAVYRNEAGEIQGVFAAARDITQRKKLEKQVKDSERLATIGATAGMVGHDIRNPLQAITSDVYLLRSELSSMPEGDAKSNVKESLEGIDENIRYVNKIVQDLQDYARPINPSAKETNLQALCEDMLFKNGVPENIEASCKVENKVKKITTDPELLRRILNNLVNNALQAMPEGGKLETLAYRDSNCVVISVKDTGRGIPESVKEKLFTPLFTTKSKGQGFGLAVVKRMTESMGGTVTFESQEGKGTTFIVRFPLSNT